MLYLGIIFFIVLVDLQSKKYMRELLKDGRTKKVWKNFYLVLTFNKGAFLGLLKNRQKFLKVLIGFFILSLFAYLFYEIAREPYSNVSFALSLLLGGAIGNYIDRLKNNVVTDFLYFKFKAMPVFNIADLFIFIGCILLVITLY